MIKNPVTRSLTEAQRRKLEANKALQIVTGRLLALAHERGELREMLVILKKSDQRSKA